MSNLNEKQECDHIIGWLENWKGEHIPVRLSEINRLSAVLKVTLDARDHHFDYCRACPYEINWKPISKILNQ